MGGTATAVLGWNNMKFNRPLKVGDTMRLKTTVADKRPSSSQRDRRIVELTQEVLNQHGEMVCSFDRTLMVLRRPHC
jgi:itaconyl-CoA hydratase